MTESEKYMTEALAEAEKALAAGEVDEERRRPDRGT